MPQVCSAIRAESVLFYIEFPLFIAESVGMISKEELSYLMASGIEEERVKALIIEGFWV